MDWYDGFTTANGIRVHYRRTMSTDLPAVLLLHGLTDNAMCWMRVARDLRERFTVVMCDARGHGRTDGISGGFSQPVLAEDAAGVIQSLKLGRPVVYGHSMGAATAAVLAAEHPDLVRAAVLEDPPFVDDTARDTAADWKRGLAALKAMPSPARRRKLASDNPSWDSSEIDPLVGANEEVDIAVLDHLQDLRSPPWRETFSRIRCPVLLLTGEPSRGAMVRPETAEEAARLLKSVRVAHVQGAGHCIHRDKYGDAMREIKAFLSLM